MIRPLVLSLILGLSLKGQDPAPSASFKARALAHHPILETGKLPALPQVGGRPESTLRLNNDWLDALGKAARKGRIPATILPEGASQIEGGVPASLGWRAFILVVPARGRLLVTLEHPEADQFRIDGLDSRGEPTTPTFLTNGPGRTPKLDYRSNLDSEEVVVILVQDFGRLSLKSPFKLNVKRSWGPGEAFTGRPKDPVIWAPEAN